MTSIKLSSEVKLTKAQAEVIRKMRDGATLHIICDHKTKYFIGWGNDTLKEVQFSVAFRLERLGIIEPVQERRNSHGHFELTETCKQNQTLANEKGT